jgi:hypothetical protein
MVNDPALFNHHSKQGKFLHISVNCLFKGMRPSLLSSGAFMPKTEERKESGSCVRGQKLRLYVISSALPLTKKMVTTVNTTIDRP